MPLTIGPWIMPLAILALAYVAFMGMALKYGDRESMVSATVAFSAIAVLALLTRMLP